jgi:hypothetical protein
MGKVTSLNVLGEWGTWSLKFYAAAIPQRVEALRA